MTEQQAINAVVTTANGQVGYREGENNYNKYAAELDPLGIFYGAKQNQPWCATFDLWVFYKCFGLAAALEMLCSPKPTAIPLCKSGAQYFKTAGRWSTTPSLGAVVFFYVSGDINHQGIVTAINGKTITTVEGNSSDMVSRRTYTVGSSAIAGYGVPKWSVVVSEKESTTPEIPVEDGNGDNATTAPSVSTTAQIPMLSKGDKSEAVRAAQILLIGRGYTCGSYGADGDFGGATYAAVCRYQRTHELEADGIIGPQTWAKLLGVSA